jgi:hypothetical protein
MNTQSKVLKWSLIIGIVIVINLFFNYALSLVYKSPDYNDYFSQPQVVEQIKTKEDCVAIGGQWNENTVPQKIEGTSETIKGYCDPDFTKRQEFDKAQNSYDRNVFITLVILGALCVALGSFFGGNVVLANSMSMAGVLSFVIASMRYWRSADDLIKVIILAIALGILVWVAMRKFKNS